MKYDRITKITTFRGKREYDHFKCGTDDCKHMCYFCIQEMKKRLGELEDQIDRGYFAHVPIKAGDIVYCLKNSFESGDVICYVDPVLVDDVNKFIYFTKSGMIKMRSGCFVKEGEARSVAFNLNNSYKNKEYKKEFNWEYKNETLG